MEFYTFKDKMLQNNLGGGDTPYCTGEEVLILQKSKVKKDEVAKFRYPSTSPLIL